MRSDYYLSDTELVALCRCAGMNVIVFRHYEETGTLIYCRHCIVDATQPLVYTSIKVRHGDVSVRSHFERLTLLDAGTTQADSSSRSLPDTDPHPAHVEKKLEPKSQIGQTHSQQKANLPVPTSEPVAIEPCASADSLPQSSTDPATQSSSLRGHNVSSEQASASSSIEVLEQVLGNTNPLIQSTSLIGHNVSIDGAAASSSIEEKKDHNQNVDNGQATGAGANTSNVDDGYGGFCLFEILRHKYTMDQYQ